jgi:hypothetical protein
MTNDQAPMTNGAGPYQFYVFMAESLRIRVARLEAEVAALRKEFEQPKRPGWLRAAEKYAGDADLLAVFAEARKLREAERKLIRRRRSH